MSQLQSEQEWLRTVGTLIVAFFCLSVGLHLAQTAVVPFVLAVLISVTAAPLIEMQRAARMPHAAAVASTLILVLAVVALVTALLFSFPLLAGREGLGGYMIKPQLLRI